MKRFLKWTSFIVAVGAGTYAGYRAVQGGRRRLKTALGHAEAIADKSRQTLAETQAALHEARGAL